MYEWLTRTEFLSVPLWNWLAAMVAACVAFLLFVVVLRIAVNRVAAIGSRFHSLIAKVFVEILRATSWTLLTLASIMIGLGVLDVSARWGAGLTHLWFVLVALQVGLWMNRAIHVWINEYLLGGGHASAVTATLVALMARGVVWATVLLAILDNVGVNITAFVASMGIGGIAVALAAQAVLGDLFASISIGIDKPFEVGDFIIVGSTLGSIEHVGLKTTRIRSLGGEQIVWSNTELLKQTIQNYKRMQQRRIAFSFQVSYRTSSDVAETLGGRVKALVESVENTRFDRGHLARLGANGLEFEVVYYVLSPDYNVYMDIQQRINIGIMRLLEEVGSEFALPERTVRMLDLPGQRGVENAAPAAFSGVPAATPGRA